MAEIQGLTVKLALDSANFKQGITALNNQMKNIQSEFKTVSAGIDDIGNSFSGLKSKSEYLAQMLNTQAAIVEKYGQKLSSVKSNIDGLAAKHTELAAKLESAKAALNQVSAEYGEGSASALVYKNEIAQIQTELQKNSSELLKASSSYQKLSSEQNKAIAIENQLMSEFTMTNAALESFSNTAEGMSQKITYLSNAITQQESVMAGYASSMTQSQTAITQLEAKQSELITKIEQVKSAYATGDSTMKQYGNSTTELDTKLDKLEKELTEVQEKLRQEQAALASTGNSYKTAASDLNTYQSELRQTQTALNEVNKSGQGVDSLGNSFAGAAGKGSMFEGVMAGISAAITNLLIQSIHQAISAMEEFAKSIVTVGESFEYQMDKVEALSGATVSEMNELTSNAKQIGATTKLTAEDAAEGYEKMALAGWSVNDMLQGYQGILDLSIASTTDLGKATDIVTDYLTAFNLTSKDSGRLADVMCQAQRTSNTTVEQLGEAYKACAPTATAFNMSLEDTTALLAILANNGIKGSEAGTALNSVLARLYGGNKKCNEELEKYGIKLYDANGKQRDFIDVMDDMDKAMEHMTDQEKNYFLKNVAGTTRLAEMAAIIRTNKGEIRSYTSELENCEGTAAEMVETMTDNLQSKNEIIKSQIESIKLMSFDATKSMLNDGADAISALLGAVIEELPYIFSQLQGFFDTLSGGFQWIAENAQGLIMTFIQVGDKIQEISNFAQTAFDIVASVVDSFSASTIIEAFSQMAQSCLDMEGPIGEVAKQIEYIITLGGLIPEDFFAAIKRSAEGLIPTLETTVKKILGLNNPVGELAGYLKDWAMSSAEANQEQANLNETVDKSYDLVRDYGKLSEKEAQQLKNKSDTITRAAKSYKEYSGELDTLKKQENELMKQLDKASRTQDENSKTIENLNKRLDENHSKQDKVKNKMKESNKILEEQGVRYEDVEKVTGNYNKAIENSNKLTELQAKVQNKTEQAILDGATAAEKQATQVQSLTDEYEYLTTQENLDVQQKARLQTVIGELNRMLGLEITAVSSNDAEWQNNMNTLRNVCKTTAGLAAAKANAAQQIVGNDAEETRVIIENAKSKIKAIRAVMAALGQEATKDAETTLERQDAYNKIINEHWQEIRDTHVLLDAAEEQLDGLNATTGNIDMSGVSDGLDDVADSAGNAGNAAEGAGNKAKGAGDAAEGAGDKAQKSAKETADEISKLSDEEFNKLKNGYEDDLENFKKSQEERKDITKEEQLQEAVDNAKTIDEKKAAEKNLLDYLASERKNYDDKVKNSTRETIEENLEARADYRDRVKDIIGDMCEDTENMSDEELDNLIDMLDDQKEKYKDYKDVVKDIEKDITELCKEQYDRRCDALDDAVDRMLDIRERLYDKQQEDIESNYDKEIQANQDKIDEIEKQQDEADKREREARLQKQISEAEDDEERKEAEQELKDFKLDCQKDEYRAKNDELEKQRDKELEISEKAYDTDKERIEDYQELCKVAYQEMAKDRKLTLDEAFEKARETMAKETEEQNKNLNQQLTNYSKYQGDIEAMRSQKNSADDAALLQENETFKEGMTQAATEAGMENGQEWAASIAEGISESEEIPTALSSVTDNVDTEKLTEGGKKIGTSIADGIKTGIEESDVEGTAVKHAETITDTYKDTLGIHSPSTVFKEIGQNMVAGLQDGIGENQLDKVAEEDARKMIEAYKKAGDQFKEAGNSIGDVFIDSMKSKEILAEMNDIQKTASDNFVTIKEDARENLLKVKEELTNAFTSTKEMPTDTEEDFNKINEQASNMKDKVGESVDELAKDTTDSIKDNNTQITTDLDEKTGTIETIATSWKDAIVDAMQEAKDGLDSIFSDIESSISSTLDSIGSLNNSMGSMGSIPSYAQGTSFHPGGLAITSEKGPELLNLPRGTSVSSTSSTLNMLASANKGIENRLDSLCTALGTLNNRVYAFENSVNKNTQKDFRMADM